VSQAEVQQQSRLPLAFTVPKGEDRRNEDSFYYRSAKGIYALSDGASVSFDSASWSRILARRYSQKPRFGRKWLDGAIAEFRKLYDRNSMPWAQQASFDRGSFASLLGVRVIDQGRLIQVLSIGDSIAVLCDGDRIKASFPLSLPSEFTRSPQLLCDGDRIAATFPFSAASEFNQSPQLLCTNPAENAFLDEADVAFDFVADWSFSGLQAPALLCMTDALGHWLLSQRDRDVSPVQLLRGLRTVEDFTRFVAEERAAGRMKRDDTTLIALW
jgi:hypothetical protein